MIEAVALPEGQWSESAVRDGNDNIGHAHEPPRGRTQLRRAVLSFEEREDGNEGTTGRLVATYLEPGPPGVYHPFASRYFAKLPGIPARSIVEKTHVANYERVATLRERNG